MANLRITEFPGLGNSNQTDVQAVATPPTAEQPPLLIGAAIQSAAFKSLTKIIRVHAEAICAVLVGGVNPVATAGTSARFIAGQTEYFTVAPGDKLSVILDT